MAQRDSPTSPDAVVLFEDGSGGRTEDKQQFHTREATALLESDLKGCLLGLTKHLFGEGN